jgi:hypothetical protein
MGKVMPHTHLLAEAIDSLLGSKPYPKNKKIIFKIKL